MKLLIGILLSMSLSTQALANHDNVVAESDTGMVYSTLSCKGVDFEITTTRVNKDYFDYLEARVDFEVECVDRRGKHRFYRGGDVVKFLTLTFDWETQTWKNGNKVVATLTRNGVTLNEDLDLNVWTNFEETHLAFKVQFKEKPEN